MRHCRSRSREEGHVRTLTCHGCGLAFSSAATTATRCRRCRRSVRVPTNVAAPPDVLVLLLSCGHVSAHFGEEVRADQADEWLWTCLECDADEQTVVRVVAELGDAELEDLTEEQIIALVEAGSGYAS
jgi:hypothetical protein